MGLQSAAWLARVPCISSAWSFIPLQPHSSCLGVPGTAKEGKHQHTSTFQVTICDVFDPD